ncbi:MAG: hypothetical protein EXR69_03275 [Myxococcales bacterium]|nr:hypothetical protein [Myxococcales bacterium]
MSSFAMPGFNMPRVQLGDVQMPRIPTGVVVALPVAVARAPSPPRDEPAGADAAREPLRIRVSPSVPGERDEPLGESDEDTESGEEGERTERGSTYATRYSIEEALGAAPGLSRYLAVQEPSVRRVVLTVLRSGDRSREVQEALESRFLRDARLLARLKCPSLASTYDAGRAADRTVFQTEDVPYGPSLRHLSDTGSLTSEQLHAVVRAVATGLAAMHEAGVPHRCLRGAAVSVPGPADTAGAAAVIGRYGLHVLPEDIASSIDAESVMVWPPESLGGLEPDEAADVYAFGVLLYHALAKRPPYAGTAAEVRTARLAGPPAPLPRVAGLAGQLTLIADRCLLESADARYPTARALIEALDNAVRVSAPPPPPPVPPAVASAHLRRTIRGTMGVLAAGAAIPSVVLLGLFARQFTQPQPPPSAAVSVDVTDPAAAAAEPAEPVSPIVPAAATGVVPGAPVSQAPVSQAPVSQAPVSQAPVSQATGASPVVAVPGEVKPAAATLRPPVVAAKPSVPAPAAAPVVVPVTPPLVAEPSPPQPEPVAVVAPAPAAPAAPAKPMMAGASELTGLWLGKMTGGTLALDLRVSSDGRVQGRARRSDRAGEAVVSGRVSVTAEGLQIDFSVVSNGTTDTYSAVIVDGALQGRMSEEGKGSKKFSARR